MAANGLGSDTSVDYTVAVILPTYCEAQNIEGLIRRLLEIETSLIIIIIDDCSPDGTAEIVGKLQQEYDNILLKVRPAKLGLGTAITDGFRAILSLKDPPSYIITMDADYSHNPQDIPRLLHYARVGTDLVIGSRYCRGGRIVGWHTARWLISRVANFIASLSIGERIYDCTSGLRCYSQKLVETVLPTLHSQTYEIQLETVKQALFHGFRVEEVPITFVNRRRGKSKLTLAEFHGFLSYIIRSRA